MPDTTDLLAALAALSESERRHLARHARDVADAAADQDNLRRLGDVWLALAVLAAEVSDDHARMLAALDAQLEDDDGLAGEIVA